MAARWQRCNDVLMSWLICSVSKKIVGEILHPRDAMTAWETLQSSYAGTNLARISEIQRELGSLEACACCKKHMDDKLGDRVVKFLKGLNDCYSSVRTHVFAMDETPKFSVVYGLALQEEASWAMRTAGKVEASTLFSQNSTEKVAQTFKNNQTSTGYNNQMRGRDNARGSFNRGRLMDHNCMNHKHS
ncbi:unnamed protein product [Rhodiola kirilowii]